jgi:hypothetical protein
MHDGRAHTADIALIRRVCDRAGLKVVDIDGGLFLVDDTGTLSWFNPLLVDKHAQMLFDAMHLLISGRLLTRRLVSPTGESVSAVCGPGKARHGAGRSSSSPRPIRDRAPQACDV